LPSEALVYTKEVWRELESHVQQEIQDIEVGNSRVISITLNGSQSPQYPTK